MKIVVKETEDSGNFVNSAPTPKGNVIARVHLHKISIIHSIAKTRSNMLACSVFTTRALNK